jgi:hypothetical protein
MFLSEQRWKEYVISIFRKHVQYITMKVCPEPVEFKQGLAAKEPGGI